MANAFIERLRVKNFGCLNDASVDLTPLHAFIGPNDSGKSTLLRAARTVVHFAAASFESGPEGFRPFDPGVLSGTTGVEIEASVSGRVGYRILGKKWPSSIEEYIVIDGKPGKHYPRQPNEPTKLHLHAVVQPEIYPGRPEIKGARLVRFDPDALRQPSKLIPESEEVNFEDERGLRLPGVYDAIRNRGDDNYWKIVEDVKRLFPTIAKLQLHNLGNDQKTLGLELTDGKKVSARFMSEGLLYYLAFAAMPYLAPTSLLLVEEPENGLHPARIRDVLKVLREISKTTQVLIATHSPLVINELTGDEVTVVTRDKVKGTQVKRISATPNFKERSKVYALGELWISYANGEDEQPLLTESESL